MLNWGDKEAAERLATQLQELLRDRTMTFDQLAQVYSIKHGQSINQRLKEMSRNGRPMVLGDFIAQMEDYFEAVGKSQVRTRGGAAAKGAQAGGGGAGYPSTPAAPAAPAAGATGAAAPDGEEAAPVVMKYADVSRGVQNILKEQQGAIPVVELDGLFEKRFGTSVGDIVGMSTEEYLQRKENIFDYNADRGTVRLHSGTSASGPPAADPSAAKDEAFVVREFEQLIESMGPVVYISTLCGKFIQRNGISVTSIIAGRPLDVFKRHSHTFLIVGQGNVTLKKYEQSPEVQRLVGKPASKAARVARAADEMNAPVPEIVTEQHVVEEFRRLILADSAESVYISSLCGRFLQRFKKPVTAIINCKPADFLRRYPDVFVMTGGGNVGLREVLGQDAVSVPPPPPRLPKALREANTIPTELVEGIELDDEAFAQISSNLHRDMGNEAVKQRLMQAFKLIEQSSFLALDEVVVGGAAGKGLTGFGVAAELVLFVRQLPFRNFPQWLPHILDTLAPVYEANLRGIRAERFKVERDHVRFYLLNSPDGLPHDIMVQVYVSPVFKGRDHLLECIKASPRDQRFYYHPAFVKERNDFVARQPRVLREAMCLMAWWTSKQGWSSNNAAPSNWLMESAIIHSFRHIANESGEDESSPRLMEVVTGTLATLAGLDTIKATWEEPPLASYAADEIDRELLSQEPLFMDPVNPYANMLELGNCSRQEIASAAQLQQGLFPFKREAAKWLARAEALSDDGEGASDEEFADAEEG